MNFLLSLTVCLQSFEFCWKEFGCHNIRFLRSLAFPAPVRAGAGAHSPRLFDSLVLPSLNLSQARNNLVINCSSLSRLPSSVIPSARGQARPGPHTAWTIHNCSGHFQFLWNELLGNKPFHSLPQCSVSPMRCAVKYSSLNLKSPPDAGTRTSVRCFW